ncbi:MAG: efflux RND transporter periplasmic adaptor subunit [Cytophagales bacterium]|nr:efflux RND transporter periplasmic adaptor subunit [Cytophagales bacterium]
MKFIKQLILTALVANVIAGCGAKKEEQQDIIRPVMYRKVVPGGAVQERTFSGTAISGTETSLSFRVSGNIRSLRVNVGEEVYKNRLIATLDDADLELEYEKADAAVKNADAKEEQAESNFERIRSLYENGNLALSDYESAKAAYESARASESSAKKARKLARAQLEYTKLYSPVTGKVATVDAEVNENVNAGQQIVLISSESDMKVNLGLPESFISAVNVQDNVEVTFSALQDQVFQGIVSEVSFAISSQTSTYPVVVKLEGDTRSIRPGMAASVKFKISTENISNPDLLLVPSQAVGEDELGNFVFALEASDDHYLATRRSVTVGQLTSGGFEILEGLDEGELVATAGLQTLLDSMRVQLFQN